MKSKNFRHQYQLLQLAYLDPPAHEKARKLLILGEKGQARNVIVAAINAALNRYLSTGKAARQDVGRETPKASQPLPAVPPAPGADTPLFDLVIASKKSGYGITSRASAPVLWYKLAGQPKQNPKGWALTQPAVQARLQDYELVDTEVRQNQVIRKYCKIS